MVSREDLDHELGRLTRKVRRVAAGADDVEFATEGTDELCDLYEAVAALAERARAREEDERRLEAIVQNTDSVIYLKDRDGRYEFVNEAAAAFFGMEPAEVVGKRDEDLFDQESITEIREHDRQVLESGETVSEEVVRVVDGEEVVFLDNKYPYRDRDGEVVGVVGISRDVTERKASERELERERDRFATLFDSLPNPAFHAVAEGGEPVVEDVNAAFEETFGYEKAEIRGEMLHDVVTPQETETELASLNREILREGEYQTEVERETVDGVRTFRVAVTVQDCDEGPPEGYVVYTDITEQRERERELAPQASMLDSLFEQIPINLYVKDEEGRHLRTSTPYIREEFPDDEEWFRGKTDLDIYPEELARETYADDMRVIESGEQLVEKVEFDPVNETWVLTSKVPWRDESGEIRGLIGVSQDITDQKKRERMLETTSARLEALFGNSPDMIEVLDTEGRIVDANQRLCDELGYAEDELVGTPIWEHDTQVDSDDVRAVLENTSVGERRRFEGEYQRSDGSAFPVEVHLIHLDLEDENCFMAITRDITERKERERDLRETKRRLELALEETNTGVWEWDVETGDMTWSETFERMMRIESGGFEGTYEAFQRRVHPDDWPRVEAAIERSVENDELYQTEFRLRREDGSWLWVGARGRPVTDEDGGRRLVGINNDVTERKERERELERTRDLLERVQQMAGVGGWELDVRSDPPEGTWTTEMHRLLDLPEDADVDDLETIVGAYHPDDRGDVRETIEESLENGTGYELEARLLTRDGDVRWARTIATPIREDGEVTKFRGSVQDVTEQKERELALESLHDATRDLLQTETDAEIAELVVDAADDVLDVPGASVYLLDADANELQPVAFTGGFVDHSGGTPVVPVGADSPVWDCFVTGTSVLVGDGATDGDAGVFDGSLEGGLLVPIGNHGVFVVTAPTRGIDQVTRQLVETLVATTEAAFERLDSEANLRERDAELEVQNRRLRRQIRINEMIRGIDQILIGAAGRAEIERAVCDRLVESEDVSFAWIGALDPSTTRLEPGQWAGPHEGYLDTVDLRVDGASGEPAVVTARTEAPTLVSNVLDDLKDEDWRREALAEGFHSVVSVPLAVDEYFHGVLTVYADDPDAFQELEQTVFTELGESIGNSITAVEAHRALHADVLVELRLELVAADSFLARVARLTDCRVTYEGLAAREADRTRVFFTTSGASADDVDAVLADLVAVADYRLITESNDQALFEATVSGDVLPARLVRHGGRPRSIDATGDGLEVVVDVPATVDVREFVEALREAYPSVELVGRREVERNVHTRQGLVASLLADLTDRQRETLRTAYYAGFFEWPRQSTGEDIAEMLGVTQPTVNRHLRLAQKRLLGQLLEGNDGEE